MAWNKSANLHVPEWLAVRMLGLRESLQHIGLFLAGGLVAGFLWGSLYGWINYDTYNAQKVQHEIGQRGKAAGAAAVSQLCREMPGHLSCGDNLKRLCKATPDAAACGDYRSCIANPAQPKCAQFKDW